jgi:hypothetical protein
VSQKPYTGINKLSYSSHELNTSVTVSSLNLFIKQDINRKEQKTMTCMAQNKPNKIHIYLNASSTQHVLMCNFALVFICYEPTISNGSCSPRPRATLLNNLTAK